MTRRAASAGLVGLWLVAISAVASEVPSAQRAGGFSSACPVSFFSLETGSLGEERQTFCLEGATCSTSAECASLCSGFATANCVENGCQYTYGPPGGGSGGGGGGGSPYCLAIPCQTYQDCNCLRPDGIYDFGQCIQGVCQY